jgi:hypothetical protein
MHVSTRCLLIDLPFSLAFFWPGTHTHACNHRMTQAGSVESLSTFRSARCRFVRACWADSWDSAPNCQVLATWHLHLNTLQKQGFEVNPACFGLAMPLTEHVCHSDSWWPSSAVLGFDQLVGMLPCCGECLHTMMVCCW